MADPSRHTADTKTEIGELATLVKEYAVQETVGPLKQIGRTLAVGSAAAVVFSLAALLSLIGLLRALQTETGSVFSGEWSWVPYLLTVIAALAFIGVAAALVLRHAGTEQP